MRDRLDLTTLFVCVWAVGAIDALAVGVGVHVAVFFIFSPKPSVLGEPLSRQVEVDPLPKSLASCHSTQFFLASHDV